MIQPIGHICSMYVWCICPMYIWCIFSTNLQIQDLGFIIVGYSAIHMYSIQPPNLTLEPDKWVPNKLALDMAALAVVWCFNISQFFGCSWSIWAQQIPIGAMFFLVRRVSHGFFEWHIVYAQLAGWGSPRGWGECVYVCIMWPPKLINKWIYRWIFPEFFRKVWFLFDRMLGLQMTIPWDAKKSHPNVRTWGPLGAPAQCANAPLAPFAGKDILTFPARIPHDTTSWAYHGRSFASWGPNISL